MERQLAQAYLRKKQLFTAVRPDSMKKIALVLLCFWSPWLVAQRPVQHAFYYGISTSIEFQTLGIRTQTQQENAPFLRSGNRTGAGGGIGIWGRWPVLPMLSFRPGLQFAYTSNTLQFQTNDEQVITCRYTFSDIELPVHFVLSDNFQNLPFRGLILFGGRLSWNLTAGQDQNPLQLLPERLGLDIGIGAGFRAGKWEIQPELTYSYGLNNVHDFQNTPFDWAVGQVLRDRLSLRILLTIDR
ncbi:MAG: hypothetical protein EP344_00075 [Bacteroidetes bacterium]|nr:MAG: hypothetical protein EP344_00075 [Bacteroidota bacterium]